MKRRILMFLLTCIMLATMCVTLVNCDFLTDAVAHKVQYVVDGTVYYEQEIYSATEIKIPDDPSRLDYDFAGWFYDEDTWKQPFNPAALGSGYYKDKDIVVYAKWVPHQHKITNGVLGKLEGKFFFSGKCEGCDTGFDNYVDVKETVIVRATCLAEGSSKYTYTLFGVEYSITDVTPKGNHAINSVDVSTLVDENGYFPHDIKGVYVDENYIANFKCGETAPGMFICSDCGDYLDVTVVKSHKFDTWTMKQVGIGEDEYYELSSTCARSDCDAKNTYNAEERFLTESVNSEPTCTKQGSKTVTYNNEVITVECEAVIGKTAHIFNGKPIDTYVTTNGAYNYYDKNGNVVFGNLFADDNKPLCGETIDSYFDCESEGCDNLVHIQVYKNHHLDEGTTILSATCTTGGKVKYECLDCDYLEEGFTDPTGHSYSYTLKLMADGDNDLTNDQFSYTNACKNCGEAGSTVTLTYSQVSHTIVAPDCKTAGKHIYSYGTDKAVATCQVEIPRNENHILNGVVAKDVYAGKDGVEGDGYSYKYSIPGIHITANNEVKCSIFTAELYTGYYKCENCAQLVNVDVYVDHIGERTTVTAPTCGADGSALVDCEFCGKDKMTSIPATGLHDYEYTIRFTPEQGPDPVTKYELVPVCKVCKHEDRSYEIEAADIKIEVKTLVSCLKDGVLSYTYTDGNITAYGERVYATKGEHTLNGKLLSEHIHTYTVNGESVECVESSVPGVTVKVGEQYYVGDVVDGKFVCECCNGAVNVKVIIVDNKE